jgi:hypothetical protein
MIRFHLQIHLQQLEMNLQQTLNWNKKIPPMIFSRSPYQPAGSTDSNQIKVDSLIKKNG